MKNILIPLFYLIFSSNVLGADQVNCLYRAESTLSEIDKLDEYWNKVIKRASPDWYLSYFPTGVEKATCRKKTASLTEIDEWLSKFKKKSTKNASVFGYSFVNEDETLLAAFEKLTAKFPTPRPVDSKCQDVLCAIQELFGKDSGNRILYLYLKHGFNAGPDVPIAKALSADNLEDITQGIEDFPPTAFHSKKSSIGYSQDSKDAIWGVALVTEDLQFNSIAFTNTWNNLPDKEAKQYTVVHEFGHVIDTSFGKLSRTSEWERMTLFNPSGEGSIVNPQNATSSYGKSEIGEDFAECVAAYRYNPKLLLGRSREKYIFIKYAVFDGVEYLKPELCKEGTSLSQEIANKFQDQTDSSKLEFLIDSYLRVHKRIASVELRRIISKRVKFQLSLKSK